MIFALRKNVVLTIWLVLAAWAILAGAEIFDSSPSVWWSLYVLRQIVAIILFLIFLWRYMDLKPKDLGLGAEQWNSAVTPGWIILACALFFATAYGVTWAMFLLDPDLIGSGSDTAPPAVWEVASLAVSAAFAEELLYRAIPRLFLSLQDSQGRWLYFFAIPCAFAAAHWAQGVTAVVAAFLIGVLGAFLYAISNNLWPNVVAHFAVNFFPQLA